MTTRTSLLAAAIAVGTLAALPALAQTTPPASSTQAPAATSTPGGMNADTTPTKPAKGTKHAHHSSHTGSKTKGDDTTTKQ